jgi:hypothetical protein
MSYWKVVYKFGYASYNYFLLQAIPPDRVLAKYPPPKGEGYFVLPREKERVRNLLPLL